MTPLSAPHTHPLSSSPKSPHRALQPRWHSDLLSPPISLPKATQRSSPNHPKTTSNHPKATETLPKSGSSVCLHFLYQILVPNAELHVLLSSKQPLASSYPYHLSLRSAELAALSSSLSQHSMFLPAGVPMEGFEEQTRKGGEKDGGRRRMRWETNWESFFCVGIRK